VPSLSFKFLLPYPPGRAVVDASRLIQYLRAAAALEPELCTYGNETIPAVIEREVTSVDKLQEDWKTAISEAYKIVRADARFLVRMRAQALPYGQRVLGLLEAVDKTKAAQLIEPLIDRAMKEFSSPVFVSGAAGRPAWRATLTMSQDCRFHPVLLAKKWEPMWAGLFPLRLRAEETGIEFFIVNSTDPNPGLLGSAVGHLSQEQIERLSAAVSECVGRTVVILMHHALSGWADSAEDLHNRRRVDIEKWGLLVHDTAESNMLVELFSTWTEKNGIRQVLVCSGHRHSKSRAGPLIDHTDRSDPVASGRGWVMESAAGCDFEFPGKVNGPHLLFADLGSDGILRPFRAPLDQLHSTGK